MLGSYFFGITGGCHLVSGVLFGSFTTRYCSAYRYEWANEHLTAAGFGLLLAVFSAMVLFGHRVCGNSVFNIAPFP